MFKIEIVKGQIEKISIHAEDETEEDRDLKIWPIIRRKLRSLNHELSRIDWESSSLDSKLKKL